MRPARQSFGESKAASFFSRTALQINGSRALYAVAIVLLAAVYLAAGKFGLSLASVHTNVSPVWPPTGIALAAVLLLGNRVWPGIFLGALLTNLFTPVPAASAFGVAIGNTLESVIAARILCTVDFRPSLDRARDVFKFVLVATVCTAGGATIGNLSLLLAGAASWSQFGSLWLTWWLGDLTGAVAVAPLILTWSAGEGHWLPRHRYFEAALLIVLLSVSAIVTFGESSPTPVHYYPLSRLMIPFLLWAAFRLGRRGVTVGVAVIAAFAIWGTSHGFGPFVTSDANQSLMMLQLFIASNAVTFLFLVTVVEERRLAQAKQKEDQRRLGANLAVTRILAESPEVGAALQRTLPTVGESLEWEFGCVWIPAGNGKELSCVAIWQKTPKPQFDKICRERTFEPGVGLPGRVWKDLKPAWIPDVTKDDNFPRAPYATTEGLHAAFGFPILFNDKFLGVIEFFSHEIRPPDEPLLAMFAGIGSQIGQFMERKRAEAAVAEVAHQQSALFEFADRVQHSESLPEIYDAGINAILDAVQCDRASILLFDAQRVMRFVGSRGLSDAYCKAVEGHSPWSPDQRNPQPVTIPNIETADLDDALKQLILSEGIFAAGFIPLVANGKLIGKFMIYYDQPHEFPPSEIALGLSLARQLATGIEHKRAAEALRENEERLRLATTTGKVGVWDWDIVSNRVSWTDSLYEIHGVNREEFAGTVEAFASLVHPDDRERVSKAIENSLQHDTPYQLEMRAVRPDGKTVWIYTNATVIRAHGKPVRMLGGTVDITDIRRAAQALRDSEQRYRSVIEALPAAVYTTDAEGRITMFNQAAVDLAGRVPELDSDSWCVSWKLFHPDGTPMPHAECPMAISLKSGEAVRDHEAIAERPDGTRVSFIPYPTPLHDADGNLVGAINMLVDITDRKKTEETLRHLAAIVETTDDAVISKDLNGIITSWNPAAERLYGYEAEKVIGKPISILIPPERIDESSRILERLKRGERIDHYETIRVAKDGRRIHVSLTISPIHDAAGRIIGASKIARDITEQRRAQEEIARLLAAERAARQDAEVASRTKDEFLATLSHELRTPLTAMLGWLTILRAHKLDQKTIANAIETIERNAKAQAQLIEDLVDISRIVGGKLNLAVVPTELLPVVNAAIEVVRPAADAKRIKIEVNYDATVGPVAGDASRLQQIIWNLLSNAVKFTPAGGKVSVDFSRRGGFAEFVVRDTGIGISPGFLPHVFERFRQAESSATRSHRGMGLGLAIVRHLVELHGGTVTAASDGENRGSTFTVQLPLAPVDERRPARPAPKSNGDDAHALKGLRILLVEDEPDARELIAMLLQKSGAQVEAVDTAKGALKSLSEFAPDVLVSDIGLPVESGYDLIRKVRALTSEIKEVPAIALTAFASENDRRTSLSAGFQAHLAKPIEPADLLKTITLVINGRRT